MAKWNGWTITSNDATGTVIATKPHDDAPNGRLSVVGKGKADDMLLVELAVKRDALYEDLRVAPASEHAAIQKQIDAAKTELKTHRATGAEARRATAGDGE